MKIKVLALCFLSASMSTASCLAEQYPSMFDADSFVATYHQMGDKRFMEIYRGKRIVIQGYKASVEKCIAGICSGPIVVNLKTNSSRPVSLWFDRRYVPLVEELGPKEEMEAGCLVEDGVNLPTLSDCVPPAELAPWSFYNH